MQHAHLLHFPVQGRGHSAHARGACPFGSEIAGCIQVCVYGVATRLTVKHGLGLAVFSLCVATAATALAGMPGVFFDHRYTYQRSLVMDEVKKLRKRPAMYHAVDLAGHLHTITDAQKLLDVEHAPMCGNDIDNLAADLVILLGCPAGFLALGPLHHAELALLLQRKLGMVKRSKGKETRWATQQNHQISRQIVDIVAAHGGMLHVEKLLGIRDRVKMTRKVNRMIHSWPFAQLLDFIHYKAALVGVQVIEEDPRHTSQRCSRCGHTERKNRQAQAVFHCQTCGYTVHADLNAARNLAAKGACSSGVGAVTAPLNGEVQ